MSDFYLSDVCEVASGQSAPQKKDVFGEEGYSFIRAGSLEALIAGKDNTEKIRPEIGKKLRLRLFPENTILFAKSGMSAKIGRVYKLKEPSYVVSHLAAIIPKEDKIDSEWLKRWFEYNPPSRLIPNEAYPSIKLSEISRLKINLESLSKQKKISTEVNKADNLCQKRKEQLTLFDDYVNSVFIEMFGDPIINPMRWEVKKLDDLANNITNGTTPKGGKNVYVKEGITFFRSQNVWKKKLECDDIAYIDKNIHRGMKKSSLKNRDILMTKTGRFNTENSSLGRAAIFLGKDDSANINGHVYLIRLDEYVNNEFVLFILTTNSYRDYIRSVSVGGIDKRQINKSHLQEFPIIFPPLELQNKFISIVNQVEQTKQKMQESLEEMDNHFNALMQRYFG